MQDQRCLQWGSSGRNKNTHRQEKKIGPTHPDPCGSTEVIWNTTRVGHIPGGLGGPEGGSMRGLPLHQLVWVTHRQRGAEMLSQGMTVYTGLITSGMFFRAPATSYLNALQAFQPRVSAFEEFLPSLQLTPGQLWFWSGIPLARPETAAVWIRVGSCPTKKHNLPTSS